MSDSDGEMMRLPTPPRPVVSRLTVGDRVTVVQGIYKGKTGIIEKDDGSKRCYVIAGMNITFYQTDVIAADPEASITQDLRTTRVRSRSPGGHEYGYCFDFMTEGRHCKRGNNCRFSHSLREDYVVPGRSRDELRLAIQGRLANPAAIRDRIEKLPQNRRGGGRSRGRGGHGALRDRSRGRRGRSRRGGGGGRSRSRRGRRSRGGGRKRSSGPLAICDRSGGGAALAICDREPSKPRAARGRVRRSARSRSRRGARRGGSRGRRGAKARSGSRRGKKRGEGKKREPSRSRREEKGRGGEKAARGQDGARLDRFVLQEAVAKAKRETGGRAPVAPKREATPEYEYDDEAPEQPAASQYEYAYEYAPEDEYDGEYEEVEVVEDFGYRGKHAPSGRRR